jgi:hypothetical protein
MRMLVQKQFQAFLHQMKKRNRATNADTTYLMNQYGTIQEFVIKGTRNVEMNPTYLIRD